MTAFSEAETSPHVRRRHNWAIFWMVVVLLVVFITVSFLGDPGVLGDQCTTNGFVASDAANCR